MLALAAPAHADPVAAGQEHVDAQQAPPPSGLTGDWGGLRTRLADAGIYTAASYVSETAGNASGGNRHMVTETGQFSFGLTIDTGRLLDLQGGTFQATATERRGKDLTQDASLGVLQQVQEVYGRGQTARLTQFWYEQKLLNGGVALKVGRATVGEDFASFSCYFMNLSFCGSAPGNLAGSYWYNWPVSQWAGRLKLNRRDFYLQVGAYEENPSNLDKGFTIGRFHGATGFLVPVELGWTPGATSDGPVASYKLGGWWSSANSDDVLLDVNHQRRAITGMAPLQRSSHYGGYIDILQQLGGTAKNGKLLTGWGIFLNLTQTDRRTSITDNQISAGLFWKAAIPSLPNDVLGIAVARTKVNGRYERNLGLVSPSAPHLNAEYAAEIYYSLHPFGWLELRPNLQTIIDPGGDRTARNVVVLGLKAGLTL